MGEWSKATRHFEAAADAADDDLAAQAREALSRIERAGLARLQEIQALEAIDEVADAIAAYQEFVKEFAGFPAAEEAKRRLEALRKRRK
jgi:hypothetical protein